jgi:glycine cleavage system aminomethyltransferase T
VQLRVLDPKPLLFHAEPLLRDGEVVGYVRAASYGWTLGSSVGLALVTTTDPTGVTKDWLDAGSWQVDVAGELWGAEVSMRPMYDPTSARVRA